MVKMVDNYILKDIIGEGTYGKVYRAINTKKEGDFAVKIIPAEKLAENSKLESYTFNEIKTLSTIALSPHIVRYYEMLKTKNNFYFVYEYCNGGNLLQKIKEESYISQDNAINYFRQILEAFKIMNKLNIMHRDVKPQNIFFHDNQVKLGDFGFCKGLGPQQSMTKTMLGSPIYMAPQVLRGEPYSTKADIWSLGIVLYQMLYGNCPFQSNSIGQLITTINQTQLSFPQSPYVSQRTQSLIMKMVTKDCFRRIGWVQLFCQVFDENVDKTDTQTKRSNKTYQTYSSGFITSSSNGKKSSSIPKVKPQQICYSKNYIEIMESINRRQSLSKQDKEKTLEEIKFNQPSAEKQPKYYPSQKKNDLFSSENKSNKNFFLKQAHKPMSLEVLPHQKIPEIQIKRANLLKIHYQCISLFYALIETIETKEINCFEKCLVKLYEIKDKLHQINSDINLSQIQLLDISSIISFEIIQVDRQIAQMRQSMDFLNIQVPKYVSKDFRF